MATWTIITPGKKLKKVCKLDYKAKIVLDSLSPKGFRLTTFELRYPRYIHAEFLTHRVFSRNSQSNRAIPTKKLIRDVIDHPVVPLEFGVNKRGMHATELLPPTEAELCRREWTYSRWNAVKLAESLHASGVHKQVVNRVLEPYQWITTLCTATE